MAVLRTTVITAAGAAALVSLADVKDDLAIAPADTSTDAFLGRTILRVSGVITRYCGQSFAVDQLVDTFETPDDVYPFEVPGRVSVLELSAWPVSSVASVTEAGTVLDPSLYSLDPDAGLMTRLDDGGAIAFWAPGIIAVAYTGGAVPADVVDVASKLVAARYFGRGRDPNLKAESLPGVGSSTWSAGGTSAGMGASGLPLDVEAALDLYRVPVVA